MQAVINSKSENVAKIKQKARLAYIETHILLETQQEMAEACGVERKTIERDIDKWKKSGGYKKFLFKEFFELYGIEKRENPSRALDRIVTLLLKDTQENLDEAPSVRVKIIDNSRDSIQTSPAPDSRTPIKCPL
jgi:hypothetical protein